MQRIFTEQKIREIYQEYLKEKLSTITLAKKYECSPFTLQKWFKIYNLQIRNNSHAHQKIPINESYFESINTEKKAYFLGLLYADGNNLEKVGRVRIGLLATDQQILKELSKDIYFGQERIQRFPKSKHLAYVVICNKKISQDLSKYGCVNKKTFLLKYPQIDQKLIKHFIRGYFDGDGCLSCTIQKRDNYKKFYFDLLSTYELLKRVQDLLKKELGINSALKKRWPKRNNNNWTLRINGNNQILKLCGWMYDDSNVYLNRKYNKYLELVEFSKRERQKVGRKCCMKLEKNKV